MNIFIFFIRCCSEFEPRSAVLAENPSLIIPLDDPTKVHLQIIHANNAHWITSYYDSQTIYKYDSYKITHERKLRSPDPEIMVFLRHLFPFYDFQRNPIQFSKIEYQPNGCDCGFFWDCYRNDYSVWF